MNIPQPLADILKRHGSVNGLTKEWGKDIVRELKNHSDPQREKKFREQLADAIFNNTISLHDYENITGEDFDTQEELTAWLKTIWKEVFMNEPIQSVNPAWAEMEEKITLHELWLSSLGKEGTQLVCEEADLSHMDLSSRDLVEIVTPKAHFDFSFLENTDFASSNLASASFIKSILRFGNLSKANLDYAQLENADLSFVTAIKTTFEEANLLRAHLQGGYFLRSNFKKANLSYANLKGAYFEGTSFKDAQLEGADFTGAKLINADFKEAKGMGSIIAHWLITKEGEHEKLIMGEAAKKFLQNLSQNS